MAPLLLVLCAALVQIVEPLRGALSVLCAEQLLDALVHLDAGHDVQVVDEVHELGAVVRLLEQGLVEQDHAGDRVQLGLGHSEQQLPEIRTYRNMFRLCDDFFKHWHGVVLQALLHSPLCDQCQSHNRTKDRPSYYTHPYIVLYSKYCTMYVQCTVYIPFDPPYQV